MASITGAVFFTVEVFKKTWLNGVVGSKLDIRQTPLFNGAVQIIVRVVLAGIRPATPASKMLTFTKAKTTPV